MRDDTHVLRENLPRDSGALCEIDRVDRIDRIDRVDQVDRIGGGRRGAGKHVCRAFSVIDGLEGLVVELRGNEGREGEKNFEFGSDVLHTLLEGMERVDRQGAGGERKGKEKVLVVRVAEKGRRFGQRVAAGRSARGFGDAMVDMLRATDLGHATQVFEADRAVAVFDDTSRFLVIRTIFGVVGFLIADCYNKL